MKFEDKFKKRIEKKTENKKKEDITKGIVERTENFISDDDLEHVSGGGGFQKYELKDRLL